MVSHKSFGGIDLSIGAGGLRFKKRPSGFNICIGKSMKGTPGPRQGRYDKEFQAKFTSAVHNCAVPRRTRLLRERKAAEE